MEESKQSLSIPLPLMILDGIGIVLVILGFLEMEGHINIFAAWIPYEHYDWAMVIVGCILILPVMIYLMKLVAEQKRQT